MSDWSSIPQMVAAQAARYGDRAVMKVKRQRGYEEIPWRALAEQVASTALALLDMGVKRGDRVAILSENRPEWAVADLAVLSLGGATVPVYTTLTPEEIEYILRDSGAQVAFVSTPELMAKILPLQDKLGLKFVLFDAPFRVTGPRVWWLGEMIGLGKTAGPEAREALAAATRQVGGGDLATIIYTSGTTGSPKGVMLTHSNFLSNCRAIAEAMPIGEADSTLSFLPLAHVFERCAGYYFVLSVGGTIGYAENMDAVPTNLLEVRPTILTAVPRFYEKMHERIDQTVRKSPRARQLIFRWAVRVGAARARAAQGLGRGPSALSYRIADKLVFHKLRDRLGGRLRFCISGGAPLSKELGEFFCGAGVLILEGYGLTETSPVIAANRPEKFRFGTVGLALPGVEVRIAGDGEILSRGPHIMKGYFQKPEATAEAIDKDGWFHTGDIGELSPEGFLTITDRKKDLIKTSGGKMVAPQNIENGLKADPYIADCVVIGDRRKYLTALIVPEMERIEAFARRGGLRFEDRQHLVRLPEVVQLIGARVEELNRKLAPFEQLKKFTLLSEAFTLQSGELTPTLKVKRRVIAERYAAQIQAMYPSE